MIHKTCVSIAENTPKKIEQAVKKALVKSELVEIRLDFLDPVQVPDALNLTSKYLQKSVCTLRSKSEGGKFRGSEYERISILKLISEYCPFLLDVEYDTLKKNRQMAKQLMANTNVLISWHDFEATPSREALKRQFSRMAKFSKNVKIVTTARSVEDSARILELYNNVGKNTLVAFAMGDEGKLSRILCLYLGSPYTYVSLGKPVASGQFSVDEMKKMGQNLSTHDYRGTR